MASSYLWRNIGSNGNRKTMTFSAWVKRSGLDTASIFTTGSGAERDMLLFESSGIIQFSRYNGSYLYKLQTNAKYRDTNGWYHIVAVLDTPQATEANRMKLYVNGEQVTSFSAASYPSQDYQSNYNQSGYTQYVGQDPDSIRLAMRLTIIKIAIRFRTTIHHHTCASYYFNNPCGR